jgi:hypothetical protein
MCVRKFLLGILAKGGFFAIREHAQVQWESAVPLPRWRVRAFWAA